MTEETHRVKHLPAASKTTPFAEWVQVKNLPAVEGSAIDRWIVPVSRIAVPALVAGVLWRSGRTRMAIVIASIAVVLALASLISVRARSAVESATEWLAAWARRLVSFLVLTIVYALVFVPISLGLRLRGRDPLQMRFAPGRDTYWDPVIRPVSARRLYTRPFAFEQTQEAGTVGRSRSVLLQIAGQLYVVFAAVAALLVANFLIGRWLVGSPPKFREGLPRGHEIPALRSYPWIPKWEDDYARQGQKRFTFRPLVDWRHPDFESEWINNKSGIRKSYEPDTHGQPPVVLHFFGGSTMWGTHQRDLHTIPSEVARIAEAHGIPVKAVNYGQLGYMTIQEVALFMENCVAGKIPDIAIFYDGFNDIAYTIVENEIREDEPLVRMRSEMVEEVYRHDDPSTLLRKFSAVHWLYDRWLSPQAAEAMQDKSLHTPEEYMPRLERWYFGNARLAHQLGSAYGPRVFSFLQPHYATKKLDPRELPPELYRKLNFDTVEENKALIAIVQLLRQRLPGYMIDLSSALDNAKEPVMTDVVHTSELGAQMIAEEIFKHVEPALHAVLRDREAKPR